MLKEDLSIDTTFNPHKFSSDSTFKLEILWEIQNVAHFFLASEEWRRNSRTPSMSIYVAFNYINF